MKQKYFLIYLVLVLFLIPLYGIDVPLSIVDTISFGDPSLSTVQHHITDADFWVFGFICGGKGRISR